MQKLGFIFITKILVFFIVIFLEIMTRNTGITTIIDPHSITYILSLACDMQLMTSASDEIPTVLHSSKISVSNDQSTTQISCLSLNI